MMCGCAQCRDSEFCLSSQVEILTAELATAREEGRVAGLEEAAKELEWKMLEGLSVANVEIRNAFRYAADRIRAAKERVK